MTTSQPTVLRPDDTGYDARRGGFQTYRPQRPAAVVVATSVDDLAPAVRFARGEHRPVAVQTSGHGTGAVDPNAALIDVSALREVTVDPVTRTARAAAGARWGDVIAAAAPHGLAPLSGSSPHVGVVGYLVGGGVPILGRRHGYAATRIREFEVVTAAGVRHCVPAAEDGLGWALRGGGSFAVVAAVTFELIELSTVYGGSVIFSDEDVSGVVRGWRDWAAGVSDAMGTSVAVVPFPQVPAVPPPLRGRTGVAVRVAFDGPAGTGQRLSDALLRLGTPLLDGRRELPWTESDQIHRDPVDPAASTGTTVALRDLTDADIAAVLDTLDAAPVRRVAEFRRLGGALAEPTGLPLRHDAQWSAGTVNILTGQGDAVVVAPLDAAVRDGLAADTVGRLANFLFGEGADPAAVRSAYSAADWTRLTAIRAATDPEAVLLGAAPIPPA